MQYVLFHNVLLKLKIFNNVSVNKKKGMTKHPPLIYFIVKRYYFSSTTSKSASSTSSSLFLDELFEDVESLDEGLSAVSCWAA